MAVKISRCGPPPLRSAAYKRCGWWFKRGRPYNIAPKEKKGDVAAAQEGGKA